MDYDILAWMDEPARADFSSLVQVRHYRAGRIIYLEGDEGNEMFRIIDGSVSLSHTAYDGRQLILLQLGRSGCFGDSSLVDDACRPQTAQANADTDLQVLDRHGFDRLRRDHRSFDDAIMRLLARQMRAAVSRYADRSLDSVDVRVASRLLLMVRDDPADPSGAGRPVLQASQAELALMVGASRQHVNRALGRLERDGLIELGYGRITILDLPALVLLRETALR